MSNIKAAALAFLALIVSTCSAPTKTPEAQEPAEESVPPHLYESGLPEDMRPLVDQVYTGDLDGMVKQRFIRAGVTFNRTFYFVDRGAPYGLAYEYLMRFEEQLNKKLNTGKLKVHVVLLPMPRDELIPSLNAGKIDLVVAQLTVTPERQKIVEFSHPTRSNVNEVVVTAPGDPSPGSIEALSGQRVFLRKSSSYYESVQTLNQRLKERNSPPVEVIPASESLEDDDILEMVNAGLVPATVVDNFVADFWKQVYKDIAVHDTLQLRSGGNLAVAIRKNSPMLEKALNEFIDGFGLDSAIGRMLNEHYLENTKYVKSATSQAERAKFTLMVDLFKKYGDRYSFDYLLMGAQGFQESGLNQNAKSPVGAVGVMQVMPDTGRELKVGDITKVEPNIHAGVKYMRNIRDQYFEMEPMDDLNKALFTFAAYNAGPNRIQRLREEAGRRGLDPNVWFGNVERIVSERVGREPVTYVSNIYKYYVAYRLLTEEAERRKDAKSSGIGVRQ